MSNIITTVEKVSDRLKIAELPEVRSQFEKMFIATNTESDSAVALAKAEANYLAECSYFNKLIAEKPELKDCTPVSLYNVFIEAAISGMSLNPDRGLTYVMTRNVNIGNRDAPSWQKRAYLLLSPYGELALRIKYGHIKYADNPVLVYEGDSFRPKNDASGNFIIEYEKCIPRKSSKIIAAFIKLVRHDGSNDFKFIVVDEDIARLAKYSAKSKGQNAQANALYTSNEGQIDPGFLMAKLIKHAFKNYPKAPVSNIKLASDEPVAIDPMPMAPIEASHTDVTGTEESPSNVVYTAEIITDKVPESFV